MGYMLTVFLGTQGLFALLGSASGGFFLSLVAAMLAYAFAKWFSARPKGTPVSWREIGAVVGSLNLFGKPDAWPIQGQRDLFYILNQTIGAALTMMAILHIYLVPLLITDSLDPRLTGGWMEFTDPVLGALGGLSVSVRNFTRDLIALGYPDRILIVRHVYGVVFACLLVFSLRTLWNSRKIAMAIMNLGRGAAAHPHPRHQSVGGKVRLLISFVLLILASCFIAYMSMQIVFFCKGIRIIGSSAKYLKGAPSTVFNGTVHVNNTTLLDAAWLGPLTTHGVILLFLLVCLTAVVFVSERRRLRLAE